MRRHSSRPSTVCSAWWTVLPLVVSILGYIHCNFCLNPQMIHGDMKENVSGCFFLNTLYIRQNQPTLPSWRYGMISHRSSLIRKSCDFERDFDFVLLQLVDTLNTQFKYREGSWHSLLKRLKCWWKSSAKFHSLLSETYWIFITRLHVHLKKWTLKFKLLCLLNRISYFNKICRICGLNPHL